MSNVSNIDIILLQTEQGPGYGGAMLAMVGDGEYKTIAECAEKLVKIKNTVSPEAEISQRYVEKYKKFKEIYPSVKELFKKIK